ncbi:MAG TPA: TonB family protein [Allosphingosinicella sp.]|jgi:protein TonB
MRPATLALLPAAMLAGPAVAADPSPQAEANAAFVQYPAESLRWSEEGAVRYRVRIDGRGRVTECEVTQSSGYSRLDQATCNMLMTNARFTGKRSKYDGRVVWKIDRPS